MNGVRSEELEGVEMTGSSQATRAEADGPDEPEDHETIPVTIGYGALNDDEKFSFSWQRLFMFAGASRTFRAPCARTHPQRLRMRHIQAS